MSRKALAVYGLIALAAIGLLIAAAARFVRPAFARLPRTKPAAEPAAVRYQPAVAVPREEMAERLDDASCRGLILDLKMAALNGDQSTQRGLIRGLKNHGRVAKALLREERVATQDARVTVALDAALKEMP